MAPVAGSVSIRQLASWGVLIGLGVAVACLPDDPGNTPLAEHSGDVLADLGPEVIQPTLARFRTEVDALRAAVVSWGEGGSRQDVVDPFVGALAVWQEAELMQVGPAGPSLTAAGGQDLRDEIYSWPTVNPCLVDQETVAEEYGTSDFFTANLVNAYGLDALEHLLLAPAGANVCPAQVDINSSGSWNALGPDGVDANRSAYALAIVDGVLASLDALDQAWDPQGGDFGGRMVAYGTDDSPYGSEAEALNAIYDALFYLETVTKDRKLAEPLGIRDCTTDCAELAEAIASGRSSEWIAANLTGFEAVFTGGEGTGMDDLLTELGHEDLTLRIIGNIQAARDLAETMGPIDQLVLTHPEDVQALHDAIKLVTDDLKGDVATVLSMQLPTEAAGDND